MSNLSNQQRAAVMSRWNRSDVVDQRVDAIVESARRKLEKLPPLNETQRDKLRALLADQSGGRDDSR